MSSAINPTSIRTSYTKRGYALTKKYFTEDELKKIRKELMVAPFTLDDYNKPEPFPLFLESPSKIYVPKHYGFETFGEPDEVKLTRGEPIQAKFAGQLKPIQENVIKTYLDTCILESDPDQRKFAVKSNGGVISVGCGFGKCQKIDTPILMYDGSIKMVQDVQIGDQLMGDDSTPRNVLSLARGREIMYKVIPTKGDPYVVNKSHILSLKVSSTINKKLPKGTIVDMSVTDYLNLPPSYHGRGGALLGYKVPVIFPHKDVILEPYALGYWLGDGTSCNSQITTEEPEVVEYFKDYAERLGMKVSQGRDTEHCRASLRYTLASKEPKKGSNTFLNYLRSHNLINNKHIPHVYKCNSRDIQLQVLAGIIDSDGSLSHNGYDINLKSERLLDDIIYIARSLGFAAFKTKCEKSCMVRGEKVTGTYYRTYIHGKGLEDIPVKVPRKKTSPRQQIKDPLATRICLEELPEDDYYGFELDGNRRYLLGDFTVTHNTVMAIKLIAELGRKALVIVHKEFLMNQWRERITQFMPTARVGTIQGKIVDVENKDIVLCMLQSLSMKEYPDELFAGIGTAVIDECFPYKQRITTDEGDIEIGLLYTKWNNGESLPRVRSYNEKTKTFEWKRITYAWEKETNSLVEVQCYNGSCYQSTANHLYLTTTGWKSAGDLQVGDILVTDNELPQSHVVAKVVTIHNHIEKVYDIGYNKVYDIEVEDNHTFLLTDGPVVHNCHHIAAEVFSRALPKINSYYSVALSATPKRADGLSKVFHMYLGPFVFRLDKRDDTKKIQVHSIHYYDRDETYSQEEYTVMQKLCMPKMINHIAEHPRRNDMIEALVRKLVATQEAEPRKIIILSDRREHLAELYRRCEKFATVGYYVGGMKQKDLDASEKKQVIFGTYPMSSEGLDIGDLNTCIFATPKSSIEQSIGRIVRKNHAIPPLAYDIVDHFSLFAGQYKKREVVYRKLEYDIYDHTIRADDSTTMANFGYQLDQPGTLQEPKRRGRKATSASTTASSSSSSSTSKKDIFDLCFNNNGNGDDDESDDGDDEKESESMFRDE